MIPKFEKFLYPFLLFLKEGELTTSQMIEKISQYFELTEEDKQLRTRNGSITQLRDRVGWSRQYLRRALFIAWYLQDNSKRIGLFKNSYRFDY